MTALSGRLNLAHEPDFDVGPLKVSPSACRVFGRQQEVRVEAQTMAVLVVLARAGGVTVSRDELVEACWQGRVVSDDAIGRTIAKVRMLAKGMTPAPFNLETVPKVGYRLIAATADVAERTTTSETPASDATEERSEIRMRRWRPLVVAAGIAIAIPVAWAVLPRAPAPDQPRPTVESNLPTAAEFSEALLLLDIKRVQGYLDRGWDPNWKLDSEGGAALDTLFMACERNPSHDRGAVARIAQLLVMSGEKLVTRNKWDDSPLDIAISPRYCGPHHPVVDYLKSMSPAEVTQAAMARACGEAFGGLKTSANWAASNLTREECAEAAKMGKKRE